MVKAKIVWTCDNEAWIYVDGKLVDHDANWMKIKSKTIELPSTPKVITVKAKNYGGPAGFACIIEIDGKRYVTNGSWTCNGKPVYVIPKKFNPWGKVGDFFRRNGAEWIWCSKEGAMGKKDFEVTFEYHISQLTPKLDLVKLGMVASGFLVVGGLLWLLKKSG